MHNDVTVNREFLTRICEDCWIDPGGLHLLRAVSPNFNPLVGVPPKTHSSISSLLFQILQKKLIKVACIG